VDKIWVLAASRAGSPSPAELETIAAARSFAPLVEAFTYGPDTSVLPALLGQHGVRRCYDLGDLGSRLAGAAVVDAFVGAMNDHGAPDALFVVASYDGRDVAGRLSAKLDVPVITNVVGLVDESGSLVSEHAVFGGSTIARARFSSEGPWIFVIRAKSFVASPTGGPPAEVVPVRGTCMVAHEEARIVARHVEAHDGPSLDDASVVVSGGRGLGDRSNFALIEALARLLNGAVGASRAIVDAGWVPYAYQVGQTGKTVKPDVYIACGISGATQHIVGMKDAKRVIAINKDPSAPIVAIADLGVIGDATEVLPRLIKVLEGRESHGR